MLTGLAVVQAVITGFALGAAIRSANSAKRSADAALNALKHNERPYVFPQFDVNARIHSVTDQIVQWEIMCTFHNVGQRPAMKTTIHTGCRTRQPADFTPLDLSVDDKDDPPTPIAIGAGKSGGSEPTAITPSVAEQIRSGKIELFVFGKAEYWDALPGQVKPFVVSVCARVETRHGTNSRSQNPFKFIAYDTRYNYNT